MNVTKSAEPLVDAIRHRNREALNRFLAKHRDELGEWVRFRLGVPAGRGADHSDALQEVSIKIWQFLGTFEGTTEEQLLQWFQQRLRWWVVDLSRKKVISALLTDGIGESSLYGARMLDGLSGGSGTPSQLAGQAEHEARIRDAGSELTNEEMAILLLHDVDGVSLREIAAHYEAAPVAVARQYIAATTVLHALEAPLDESSVSRSEQTPAAALARALRRLPPVERHAILLKHLERFSMEEAAEVLETTPVAIGSAVYRGMRQLRKLLGQS